jgi:hypothetical protein
MEGMVLFIVDPQLIFPQTAGGFLISCLAQAIT